MSNDDILLFLQSKNTGAKTIRIRLDKEYGTVVYYFKETNVEHLAYVKYKDVDNFIRKKKIKHIINDNKVENVENVETLFNKLKKEIEEYCTLNNDITLGDEIKNQIKYYRNNNKLKNDR